MLFAFQRYLHEEKLDFKEIEDRVKGIIEEESLVFKEEEEKVIKRTLETIIYNDGKWQIGDTLNLSFKFERSGEGNIVYFNWSGSDLLKGARYGNISIQGVLLSKEYNVETGDSSMPRERFGVQFKIRVVESDTPNTYFFGTELKQGNQFRLPLWFYKRKIN